MYVYLSERLLCEDTAISDGAALAISANDKG